MKYLLKKIIYNISIILLKISAIFSKSKNTEHVLVRMVKPLGIGDVIMLSPIFKRFKNYRKKYYVTNLPFIQEIHEWIILDKKNQNKLNNKKTLLVIPSYTLSDFITAFFWKGSSIIVFNENKIISNGKSISFKKKNVPHYSDRLEYFITNKKFEYPNLKKINFQTEKTFDIILFPYVNWKSRQWPLKKWKSLINELVKLKLSICVLGSDKKEEIGWNNKIENNNITNLTGSLSLESSVYLMSKAKLLICQDSGPFHIGYLIEGLKIISIFGCTTNPKSRVPLVSSNNYLETIEPKNKCKDNVYNGLVEPKCISSPVCLDQISVDAIMKKVNFLVKCVE